MLSFCDAELIVQRNEEVLRVNAGEVELNGKTTLEIFIKLALENFHT